jgi:DNA-directed RNA polymerase beta subunit
MQERQSILVMGILQEFFDENGYLGGIDWNYRRYMELLSDTYSNDDTGVYDKYIDMFPVQTKDGTFVLNNKERYFISQELRMTTEPFLIKNGNNVELRLNILETYHQLIITMSYKDIKINVESIKKDLDMKYTEINLLSLSHTWDIRDVIGSFTSCRTSNLIRTILSTGSSKLLENKYVEVIRDKLFRGTNNEQVIGTLAVVCARCAQVLSKKHPPSDRDSYVHKYIRTSSYMVYKAIKGSIEKDSPRYIENLEKSLREGEIKIQGKSYTKMSSIISRRSGVDAVSCIRRIVIPVDENSSNMLMRDIHETQKGFICLCETTDGKDAGLVKHLACTCLITGPINRNKVLEELEKSETSNTPVLFDGLLVGYMNVNRTRIKERHGEVSIYAFDNVTYMRTHDGRLIRPMKHKLTGNIHYIDPAEQLYHGNEYQEVSPLSILGISACLIPYAEHNQAARSVFASNIIKQSIEVREPSRYSEEHRMLVYGQKPIVTTEMEDIIHRQSPCGVNLVVAIMTFEGYNQEDSVVINKASVERGLFHNIYYKNITRTVSPINEEIYDDHGTVYIVEGSTEKKVVTAKVGIKGEYKQLGTETRFLEDETKVEKVYMYYQYHSPEVGDKIASRHAQKSIIARLVPSQDMPFMEDGCIPDILVNPHAIPSRMTVGQLLESLEGKIGAIKGKTADGTAFNERSNVHDLVSQSVETQHMYLGTNGEMVRNPITVGIVYYMALRQQVREKIFSRYGGPISEFSRQPTGGKSREGGLRIGEMEHDALIAHEAYDILRCITDQSDLVEVRVCKTCKRRVSERCPRGHEVTKKRIPMSRVVTEDLFAGLSIGTRIV